MLQRRRTVHVAAAGAATLLCCLCYVLAEVLRRHSLM